MRVRLRVTKPSEWMHVRDLSLDVVEVGDEYCHVRMPSFDESIEIIDQARSAGKEWALVTPFLPDSVFEKTFVLVEQLGRRYGELNLVVNDYGLLHRVVTTLSGIPLNIAVGQMLVHSLEEFPWHDDILKDESPDMYNTWLLHGFVNRHVLQHFKKSCALKAVELNHLPHGIHSARFFSDHGVGVRFVTKYYPVAVARKCHAAAHHRIPPSEACADVCWRPYKLEIEQSYAVGPGARFVSPPATVSDEVRSWLIFGNVTCKPYEKDLDRDGFVDAEAIVVARHFVEEAELRNSIAKYQQL